MAPYDPALHYSLGIVLELLENPSGAKAAFRAAIIECAPEDHAIIHEAKTRIRIILNRRCVESLLNFGVFLHSEGDLITSEAMCLRAIEIDPNKATVHFKLGVILGDGRDLPGAETEFRAAIDCDSDLLVAHLKLAEILQERGDVAGADVEFRLGMGSEAATQVAPNALVTIMDA
jgi:tetratricopeptide (TPR) repeat protein